MFKVSNARNADHVAIFSSAGEGHRDHASVVMDEELTTTSQESHLGNHVSVAVIHRQWNYTKNQNNSHLLL